MKFRIVKASDDEVGTTPPWEGAVLESYSPVPEHEPKQWWFIEIKSLEELVNIPLVTHMSVGIYYSFDWEIPTIMIEDSYTD